MNFIVFPGQGSQKIGMGKKLSDNFPEAKEVFDVSGAGDTVVSYIASGLARNEDFVNLIEFANEAAGIAVGKLSRIMEIYDVEKVGVNRMVETACLHELCLRIAMQQQQSRAITACPVSNFCSCSNKTSG